LQGYKSYANNNNGHSTAHSLQNGFDIVEIFWVRAACKQVPSFTGAVLNHWHLLVLDQQPCASSQVPFIPSFLH
jgi:hypothetical protein